MKIALCQLNSTVGDISGNLAKISETVNNLAYSEADIFLFPELFLMGYPPRDLLDHHWFIERGEEAIAELCDLSLKVPEKAIVTGIALPSNLDQGNGLYNSAVVVQNGHVIFVQHKTLLPTYDVFDEHRYFDSASEHSLFIFNGKKIGITICEDAWNIPELWKRQPYSVDPVEILAEKGAELILNISASPFYKDKQSVRYEMISNHVKKFGVPFALVNSVGANDELVFDGGSMVINGNGDYCCELPFFEESIVVSDIEEIPESLAAPADTGIKGVHNALVLGVRDYFAKTGFSKALIGLSGGIDSAVTAAIAVQAIGAENVMGITMPSQFSSDGSVSDSIDLAENLGVECEEIAIKDIYDKFEAGLADIFSGTETGVAEENLQARIRGVLLMGVSNKYNRLLLTTGNKSEMAVGYCTLYGDMNGGLAVLADLYKTDVYDLARYINRGGEVIPNSTIDKAPSAELRPDQKDEDSLPPYEVLDAILKALIEEDHSGDEVVELGFERELVEWVIRALKINEYKRRQSAPTLKVTPKAFGMGRRFPIAAKYEW
jgi:NAD+ synthase (glutamine-hydrolysing)